MWRCFFLVACVSLHFGQDRIGQGKLTICKISHWVGYIVVRFAIFIESFGQHYDTVMDKIET